MSDREMLKLVEKLIVFYCKKDAQKLYEGIVKLRSALLERLEKEEEKKRQKEEKKQERKESVKPLIDWYIQLWQEEPPEKYMGENHYGIIGNVLKVLLGIYKKQGLGEEELKADYLEFYRREKKGITFFKKLLPTLKLRQSKEWSSPQNQRGRDYYKSAYLERYANAGQKND